MKALLEQLKKRRIELGLKQHEVSGRVGMSRQQYQRLESRGNPRLETLELVAKGLNSDILLVPREKRGEVRAILSDEEDWGMDPWKGLLREDEE